MTLSYYSRNVCHALREMDSKFHLGLSAPHLPRSKSRNPPHSQPSSHRDNLRSRLWMEATVPCEPAEAVEGEALKRGTLLGTLRGGNGVCCDHPNATFQSWACPSPRDEPAHCAYHNHYLLKQAGMCFPFIHWEIEVSHSFSPSTCP
jgi:hypothetical protein